MTADEYRQRVREAICAHLPEGAEVLGDITFYPPNGCWRALVAHSPWGALVVMEFHVTHPPLYEHPPPHDSHPG